MEAESKPDERRPRRGRWWRWGGRLAKGLGVCVLLLLLLRELFFSGSYLPLAKPHGGQILDMHCHVAGVGAGGSGCFVSRELRNNFRFGMCLKAFGVTLDEAEEQGDQEAAGPQPTSSLAQHKSGKWCLLPSLREQKEVVVMLK